MDVKSLAETIADYLREQIISGELSAGERINEVELASKLDVSRSPLREALRVLAKEYFVFSIPRKGTFVSFISIEDLLKTYQTREMCELYALDIMKQNKVTNLTKAQTSLAESDEFEYPSSDNWSRLFAYQRSVRDFHFKVVEASENPYIIEFFQIAAAHYARYSYLKFTKPGEGKRAVEDHRQILTFLENGAYENAKRAMKEHLAYSYELLRKSLIKMGIK